MNSSSSRSLSPFLAPLSTKRSSMSSRRGGNSSKKNRFAEGGKLNWQVAVLSKQSRSHCWAPRSLQLRRWQMMRLVVKWSCCQNRSAELPFWVKTSAGFGCTCILKSSTPTSIELSFRMRVGMRCRPTFCRPRSLLQALRGLLIMRVSAAKSVHLLSLSVSLLIHQEKDNHVPHHSSERSKPHELSPSLSVQDLSLPLPTRPM